MNRSGLSLVILLIVALIVAFLAMSNMKGLKFGVSGGDSTGENAVQKTRELVDQLSQAQQQTLNQLEGIDP